jgi:Na+/proline symporter
MKDNIMEWLGLDSAIWIVVVSYFCGMLAMGWWSKRNIKSQEGYLLGNRQFGTAMMVMHSFGAGTHPGAPAGVISKTVSSGASGIWISWMWMFGTPFYWLIAPLVRRMRYLTMADFFQNRFGRSASVLYVVVATAGMIVFLASVLLATTRTVQGMMGKSATLIPATAVQTEPTVEESVQAAVTGSVSQGESDMWFYGILLTTTLVFIVYSYWGGIIAAIRTDMIQGLMIIALSIIAIPTALQRPEIAGFSGVIETLQARSGPSGNYLSLFDPSAFNWVTVLLLCINAPLSMMAYPYLMSVCAAGRTEWEGRMGFTYGNILKRVCTIGWCVLGLCWLTYLINSNAPINPDTAFGDCIRVLLSPVLQGVMLACVLAAAMSSGDAVQITVAGLFSQNIYGTYINPGASEQQRLRVTRMGGLIVALVSFAVAILMRHSIVKTILDYFNILSLIGMSVALGLVWRRMNSTGVYCSTLVAGTAFIITRYVLQCPRSVTIGIPLALGFLSAVIGSLLSRPPAPERVEAFFKRIYTPIGQEHKLDWSLDKVVSPNERLLTWGGLFLVKPSVQSKRGFLIALAFCVLCVLVMWALLNL